MPSPLFYLLLAALYSFTLGAPSVERLRSRHNATASGAPSVSLSNGTYYGLRNDHYAQDFFLGMPYAQPPTGSFRFAPPQPLSTSFAEPRNATEYSPMCIGSGSDQSKYVSEDCLTINVVRPKGASEGDHLPVAVWIHGGSYVMGGSSDPRYNLSFIVDRSVKEGKPMVAASINYRLSNWGFMFSKELQEARAGNLGFRDQRQALRWVHENIAVFGGNPDEVTLWGESAGARSIGMQLVAYEGNHGDLFHRAVLESGSPVAKFADADDWQPYFDALAEKTGCAEAMARLECLRELPAQTLGNIFNSTTALDVKSPPIGAVVDGDFMTTQGAKLLRSGDFARVPLLLGNNLDEGTAYAKQGINATAQFFEYVASNKIGDLQANVITGLYPDDPAGGIPASYEGRPAAYPYGLQFKRAAAFAGDYQQHSGRRLTAETYAEAGLPVYSYMWNVHVNGQPAVYGATHFQEVAFVFDNTQGQGYTKNPFEGKPETYKELANMMSRMWVAFITSGNPNIDIGSSCHAWPQYNPDLPRNFVFDANVTDLYYIAPDTYRKGAISYLLEDLFI